MKNERLMGKKTKLDRTGKTKLHEAAERGESEKLQRLLDTGSYDVNEGERNKVWEREERERERDRDREREVLTSFLPSHLHTVDCVR